MHFELLGFICVEAVDRGCNKVAPDANKETTEDEAVFLVPKMNMLTLDGCGFICNLPLQMMQVR